MSSICQQSNSTTSKLKAIQDASKGSNAGRQFTTKSIRKELAVQLFDNQIRAGASSASPSSSQSLCKRDIAHAR
ncbi:hypothetical protein COLO4_06866 [Corchorus olitorius]|uniref:Uncharacterized protein n=1 Tax=Corchorus olitorius TaxID=93759 RepID=A0A1R3KLQ1_9ROSI|nr:hypothetical protein COLO4_06866 [Corchorus olitorius]